MTVTTEKDGGKVVISLEGKLGASTAGEFDKAVTENISDATELVFDFDKLEYMASAGLRVLLYAARVMKKQQGSMKIIHVNESVMEVFTFTGMASTMDIQKK